MTFEYSSREYQIVLRPDLLLNLFETGVMRVINELTKIEDANLMQLKVSRSSLKFKNVTFTRYIADDDRDQADFYVRPVFKSRQNKVTEPADIMTKISNVDPALACVQLSVAEGYTTNTKVKFELNIHSENGELTAKSAISYNTELSLDFDQTTPINLSSILIDANKLTLSGRPLTIIPSSFGKINMKTAVFNINLAGQKSEAEIIFYQRHKNIKSEISFKIKGVTVAREVIYTAQQVASYLSELRTIALYALIHPKKH